MRGQSRVYLSLVQECLGVSRRPDTMGSWSGPLDCEGQETIHTHCQQAAGTPLSLSLTLVTNSPPLPAKLPLDEQSREEAAQDMELVLSYYCKTRNIRYSPEQGWTEVLLVLSSLQMNRANLFNCFYAMVAKYIPRLVGSRGRELE